MTETDQFANNVLEQAKRFLELASEASSPEGKGAYLHAALLMGFCSLEAHTNAIADDFVERPELTVHEKSVLLEREVRLDDGEFKLSETLKMQRLEDRIQFLHRRFSTLPLDRSAPWWSELKSEIKLRNELTHPKGAPLISEIFVGRAIQAIIDTLNALFQAVYKTKFPPTSRGLQSKYDF